MTYESKSLHDTEAIAKVFLESLKPTLQATLIVLSGDLGSGKTTFTQVVARALGITETVTSPTFVIEKIYSLKPNQILSNLSSFSHLIHIDAYRLESAQEMLSLGWQEIILNPKNIIIIEWPEKIIEIVPKDIKMLRFTFTDEATRSIDIS